MHALLCITCLSIAAQGAQLSLKASSTPTYTVKKLNDSDDTLVNANFPEPTAAHDVARAISLWTGKPLVMGIEAQRKIRIRHEERVTKDEAIELFRQSLKEVNLSLVDINGVYEIAKNGKSTKTYPMTTSPDKITYEFDFPELTEFTAINQKYAALTGNGLISRPGRMAIVTPKPATRTQLDLIFAIAASHLDD